MPASPSAASIGLRRARPVRSPRPVYRRPHDATLREVGRATFGALVERDQAMIERGSGFNGMAALLDKRPCRRSGPVAPQPIARIFDHAVRLVRKAAAAS